MAHPAETGSHQAHQQQPSSLNAGEQKPGAAPTVSAVPGAKPPAPERHVSLARIEKLPIAADFIEIAKEYLPQDRFFNTADFVTATALASAIQTTSQKDGWNWKAIQAAHLATTYMLATIGADTAGSRVTALLNGHSGLETAALFNQIAGTSKGLANLAKLADFTHRAEVGYRVLHTMRSEMKAENRLAQLVELQAQFLSSPDRSAFLLQAMKVDLAAKLAQSGDVNLIEAIKLFGNPGSLGKISIYSVEDLTMLWKYSNALERSANRQIQKEVTELNISLVNDHIVEFFSLTGKVIGSVGGGVVGGALSLFLTALGKAGEVATDGGLNIASSIKTIKNKVRKPSVQTAPPQSQPAQSAASPKPGETQANPEQKPPTSTTVNSAPKSSPPPSQAHK